MKEIVEVAPRESIHGTADRIPPKFARLLGLDKPRQSATASNESAPLPRVRYRQVREANPPFMPGWGLKRIEGYPPGTMAPADLDKEEQAAPLWVWDVPKVLQNRVVSWNGTGRAQAAVLWEPQNSVAKWEKDPLLIALDTRTGFRWQRDIPLRETMAEQSAVVSDPDEMHVYLALSSDGERTIAFVPLAGGTLGFVYDPSGNLLRRLVIPKLSLSLIQTTPIGNLFLFHFGTPQGNETYLADAEGHLRAHFVRGKNQGTAASTLSPDGRYAGGVSGDGVFYLFEIPAAP